MTFGATGSADLPEQNCEENLKRNVRSDEAAKMDKGDDLIKVLLKSRLVPVGVDMFIEAVNNSQELVTISEAELKCQISEMLPEEFVEIGGPEGPVKVRALKDGGASANFIPERFMDMLIRDGTIDPSMITTLVKPIIVQYANEQRDKVTKVLPLLVEDGGCRAVLVFLISPNGVDRITIGLGGLERLGSRVAPPVSSQFETTTQVNSVMVDIDVVERPMTFDEIPLPNGKIQ